MVAYPWLWRTASAESNTHKQLTAFYPIIVFDQTSYEHKGDQMTLPLRKR